MITSQPFKARPPEGRVDLIYRVWRHPPPEGGGILLRKWCRRVTPEEAEVIITRALQYAERTDPIRTSYWGSWLEWWLAVGGARYDEHFIRIERPNGRSTLSIEVVTP